VDKNGPCASTSPTRTSTSTTPTDDSFLSHLLLVVADILLVISLLQSARFNDLGLLDKPPAPRPFQFAVPPQIDGLRLAYCLMADLLPAT
jgi:hypothetical protein